MEKGLTSLEATQKLKVFGKNQITTKEKISLFSILISQFPSLINAILFSAASLSFFIGNFIDGTFIVIILLLNAFFGFAQEYKAQRSLDRLKTYVKSEVRVIRDGKESKIFAEDIVPEDIIILTDGDRIPADGLLISNNFIEVDQSVLTGESLPVKKAKNDSVFLGTLITRGTNKLLVQKTGSQTRFGQIAQTLSRVTPDATPLKKRLDSLAKILSLVTLCVAVLLMLIGVFQGKEFFPFFLIVVSLSVAVIPEGLPAVLTIALALGVTKMAKKKAIVRKMQSVETLGAVQVILTDKTGTLTQNTMRVKKYWLKNNELLPIFLQACIVGNTASLIEKTGKDIYDVVGDKTDGALLLFAREKINTTESEQNKGKVVEEYSFDSQTSTITTIWEKNNVKHILVRGAPEKVLGKSKLSEKEKEEITRLFESYAKEGLRIIGFGAKISNHTGHIEREDVEKDLNFLGFVGIYDPPREEAKKAVADARAAGIHTIMVTGDNTLTATAIAKEIGLFEKDDDIITGEEMEKIPDEELEKIILKTRIFARTKPEDKLRLVILLKKMGFVVAATGDGVNDALAIKKADVGIAMGNSGTDVAKEASDIILTDDNYSTLVSAIAEGRTIYSNILKSITYLITGNLSEFALIFFGTILGMPPIFFPTQILWINIITDGLPALALASDTHDSHILITKPRNPNAPLFSKHRLFFIFGVGLYLGILFLLMFKLLLNMGYSETFTRTVIFNALILSHMAIAFVVRRHLIFKMNKFLVIGVIATLILQILITTIPSLQKIFHLGF